MADHNNPTLVFSVYSSTFPYSPITPKKDRYVGYFTGGAGDIWVFIYDNDLGGGVLTGSDVDWEIDTLGNGDVPTASMSLAEEEALWLQACWLVSSGLRSNDDSNKTPKDLLTLGHAAIKWGIFESALLEDIQNGKLQAKKWGNVWATTVRAMNDTYGAPKKVDIELMKQIGEEHDEIQKENTEEIRRKLLKG